MSSKSRRQRRRERQQRRRLKTYIIWGGIAAAALAVAGYLVWLAVRPAAGESVAVMASSDHVPEGEDPGPYNTDPPTSGRHYASTFNAGFYDLNDAENARPHPEGYLVHNLEHGYVIFWYNCELLSDEACQQLQEQIRGVMDEYNGVKLIAYPWTSSEVPLVMTSWGQIQRFEQFDGGAARRFIEQNRNRAPEPNAP